jgi:uncharacterized protein YraI
MKNMITTKGQRKKLYECRHGYGWIVFRSGDKEITEIEIYVGKDNKVRRVGNGEPLLPIEFVDEDNNMVEAT